MTIIDQEVIGEGDLPRNEFPNVPLGIFLEKVFQRNFEIHGDAKWLVRKITLRSFSQNNDIILTVV